MIISHDDATDLENIVGKLYNCDRGGVSGMVEAGYFEQNPIQAAVLVIAYIHAVFPNTEPHKYDVFLHNYENIFEYSDKVTEDEIKGYIQDVRNLVDTYTRMDT